MIVDSDTSPINYLVLIEHIDILPSLFDQVIIPQAVFEELNHERTLEAVRQWVSALPEWAVVRTATVVDNTLKLGRPVIAGLFIDYCVFFHQSFSHPA